MEENIREERIGDEKEPVRDEERKGDGGGREIQ